MAYIGEQLDDKLITTNKLQRNLMRSLQPVRFLLLLRNLGCIALSTKMPDSWPIYLRAFNVWVPG